MNIVKDNVPLTAKPIYDVGNGVTVYFFKENFEIDYISYTEADRYRLPILPISSTKADNLIEELKSKYGPFKEILLAYKAINEDPKNIGIGVAGYKY